MEPKSLAFLSDRSTAEDELGTHRDLARLLLEVVNSSSDNPLVVGLFGRWGTGKSSVIKMYENVLQESDTGIKNIVLDAWAYANAREHFGPGLLSCMARELTGRRKAKEIIAEIDSQTEIWKVIPRPDTRSSFLFGGLMLILVILVALLLYFGLAASPLEVTLITFVASSVIVQGLMNYFLPRITTTQQTRTTLRTHNSIEHFRKCFRKILRNSNHNRISIVIDNLDRVHPADAIEMIRLLKTFIIEDKWIEVQKKRLVFILPCDKYELANHLQKTEFVTDPHEFLRKLFNLGISVPELVHQDLFLFTRKHLLTAIENNFEFKEQELTSVVFILTQGALKSPRQVKTLINDFVGAWRAMEIAGLAGYEVPAPAVAFFVAVNSLSSEPVLSVDDLDHLKKQKSDDPHSYHLVKLFLDTTEPFQREITKSLWQLMGRTRLSRDEVAIPDIWSIRDAVVSRDLPNVEALCEKYESQAEILSALDRLIMADDQISRVALAWFALILIERGQIHPGILPPTIRRTLGDGLQFRWATSEILIRGGLGHVLRAGMFSPEEIVATLNRLESDDQKVRAELKQAGGEAIAFLTQAIQGPPGEYWGDQPPKVRILLEKALHSWISEDDLDLLGAVLSRIDLIETEVAGVKLCDKLSAVADKALTDEVLTALEVGFNAHPTEGNAAFLRQWVRLGVIQHPEEYGPIRLTFLLAKHLFDHAQDIPEKQRPSQDEVAEHCNRIQPLFQQHMRDKSYMNAAIDCLAFSLLAIWAGQNYGGVGTSLKSTIGVKLWDGLTKIPFAELAEEQALLGETLDRYPQLISQPDVPNVQQIVNLVYNSKLNILGRLARQKESDLLEKVLTELVTEERGGNHIRVWLFPPDGEVTPSIGDDDLALLFKVLGKKHPAPEVYSPVVEGLKPHQEHMTLPELVDRHVGEIIENTNWREHSSIDLTAEKFRILEDLEAISDQRIELIREKMKSHNSLDQISGISEPNRDWMRKKLLIES